MHSPNLPAFNAEDLNHSRPIRLDRTSDSPCVQALVAHLVADLESREERQRARKPADQERLEATMRALVLDLYAAAKADPALFIALSLGRTAYAEATRYRDHGITFTTVATAVEYLVAAGHAEGAKGFYRRNVYGGELGSHGRRTRLRASPQFVTLAEGFGMTLADLRIAETTETIRLKGPAETRGGTKPLLEYQDTPETTGMRERLARVNALLARTCTELAPGPDLGEVARDNADEEDRTSSRDRSLLRLYRVFNDGSFQRGGRFYGGWWQALPRDARKRLTINGEPTVELDFSGMHPRLCYQLAGHPLGLDRDPYAVPGMEVPEHRELVKRAFGQLLNSSGGMIRAPQGAAAMLPKGWSWSRLIQELEAQHALIAPWFRYGRGLELQALDAAIADSILHSLALRNIPCLPVHDSFIVPVRYEEVLGETMHLAHDGQLGRWTKTRSPAVIRGWTSPDKEVGVMARMAALEIRPQGMTGG